jgi:hypothetical protein
VRWTGSRGRFRLWGRRRRRSRSRYGVCFVCVSVVLPHLTTVLVIVLRIAGSLLGRLGGRFKKLPGFLDLKRFFGRQRTAGVKLEAAGVEPEAARVKPKAAGVEPQAAVVKPWAARVEAESAAALCEAESPKKSK